MSAQAQTDGTAVTPEKLDPENTVYMDLKSGRVVIQLRPDLAPNHVARVKMLCREGSGQGGSKYPDLKAEFTNAAKFVRGTVGAARTNDPDSANSQFYIMFAPSPHLDGQYTIWGQVVSGMQFVDAIKSGAPGSGSVTDPDRIVHMRVAADVK